MRLLRIECESIEDETAPVLRRVHALREDLTRSVHLLPPARAAAEAVTTEVEAALSDLLEMQGEREALAARLDGVGRGTGAGGAGAVPAPLAVL